jgi:LacI family transcriptional regulator
MAEIARKLRLSKSTVSRALSLPPAGAKVKARTRERILRAAQDLKYRPNWRARAFSRGKTHTVGLIVTGGLVPQHETIPHQILESFTQVLRDRGYHLALVPVDGAHDWRDLIFGGHVDGCATINDPSAEVVRELLRSTLPAVAMNASPRLALPVVTANDFQGGRAVGEYLQSLGHHRVAMYVNDKAISHFSQRDRLRGLIDGIGSAGDDEVIVQFVRDSHEPAVARILDQRPHATAIVCYSHYEAVPMLREICMRRLRVPDDISLISFNDCFPLDCTIPPLTRVAVPAGEIGEAAALDLLDQIERGRRRGKSKPVIFDERIVLRESCAACVTAA